MDEIIYQELLSFLHTETLTPIPEISADTSLNYDLELHGGEASELLQHFAQRFNVDMSGFEFRLSFFQEARSPGCLAGLLLIPAFIDQVILGNRRFTNPATGKKLVPVTVRDLYQAADEHKWPSLACGEQEAEKEGVEKRDNGTGKNHKGTS